MRTIIASALAMICLVAGAAKAQSPEDAAVAEVLFREGQKLFDAGQTAEACSKFAASYRLAGGLGTLVNLARCYEKIGKTASAWALYLDLESFAARAGQADRAAIARERIDVLEPQLVKLRISPPSTRVPGLEVLRDDKPLTEAAYGVAVAVDPGPHTVSARAPGHEPWSSTVDASSPGATVDVALPVLEPLPVVVAPAPVPPPAPRAVDPRPPSVPPPGQSADTPMIVAGGIAAGLGVTALAIAGGFAASAASKWDDAGCSDGFCPSPGAQTLSETAHDRADIATGFLIGGSIVGIAGTVLILVGALVGEEEETALARDGLRVRF